MINDNAIKPKLLSSQVVDRLEELVLDGEIRSGSSIPSESELVEQFGVSRVVIREAIRTLAARGLIEVRQGRRPTVNGLNATMPGDFFRVALRQDGNALLELIDVRWALEVHIARLAAMEATKLDVEAMQETIDAMVYKSRAATDDPEGFDDADAEFHQRLAGASGNRFMHLLAEALKEPLRASRTASRRGRFARGLDDRAPIEAHTRILDRVKAKDPEGAAKEMQQHLEESKEDLRHSDLATSLGRPKEPPRKTEMHDA